MAEPPEDGVLDILAFPQEIADTIGRLTDSDDHESLRSISKAFYAAFSRTTCGVEETIVGVLVAGDADRREVIVVDPDASGLINVDKILSFRSSVELQVHSVSI